MFSRHDAAVLLAKLMDSLPCFNPLSFKPLNKVFVSLLGDEAWHAAGCLFFEALLEWHFGEIASCQPTMAEAISLAKELNNMQALAHAPWHAGWLAHFERNPAEVERLASGLSELSIGLNFEPFLQRAAVLRGWARSASGNTADRSGRKI